MSTAPTPEESSAPSAFSRLRSKLKTVAKQIEEASTTAVPDVSSVAALPKIHWRTRSFVLESQLDKKRSRGRRSWILNYGDFLAELGRDDQVKGHVWSCRACSETGSPQFFIAQSTSSSMEHLRKEHAITEHSMDQESPPTVVELQRGAAAKRPAIGVSNVPRSKAIRIRELATGYILNSDHPFTSFEDPFIKELLCLYDSQLAKHVSLGRNALSAEVSRLFEIGKAALYTELQAASTSIHISFDLWTSPNHLSIITIFGHFLDPTFHYQRRMLAFRRHQGTHDGRSIACSIEQVIRDWRIESKIGACVSDNASNNDTCLDALYPQFPGFTAADARKRRLRCFGHILNLVAKAFLFGDDASAFELESDHLELLGEYDRALQHWRRKGPIGKLHNIVKFIRASPQRMEAFRKAAREEDAASAASDGSEEFVLEQESLAELELKQNNATRWNSTYLMIKRAWKKRSHITAYMMALELDGSAAARIPSEDQLSTEDWRLLGEIQQVLEPIYDMTMRTQGWAKGNGHGQLWEVMTGMEFLLDHLEAWKSLYEEKIPDQLLESASQHTQHQLRRSTRQGGRSGRQSLLFNEAALPRHIKASYTSLSNSSINDMQSDERAHMRASITNAWVKLDEYYALLADSPLYSAAVILHPEYGLSFLEEVWSDQGQWLLNAKQDLKDYFERWYLASEDHNDPFSPSPSASPRPQQQPPQEQTSFEQWMKSRRPRRSELDSELERYYRIESREVNDPVQWWADHRTTFPRLSRFALDILAIPAMASDCERAFSIAKLAISSQRHSLQDQTIEAMQMLKDWIRQGFIRPGNIVLA